MVKDDKNNLILTEAEYKALINKSYIEGALEMTKQLQKSFSSTLNNLAEQINAQFDSIISQLTQPKKKEE